MRIRKMIGRVFRREPKPLKSGIAHDLLGSIVQGRSLSIGDVTVARPSLRVNHIA